MLRHDSKTMGLQCNDCRKSLRIMYTCTVVHLFHLFQIPVMNCVCFFKPGFQEIANSHAEMILEPTDKLCPFLLAIANFPCLFGSILVQKRHQAHVDDWPRPVADRVSDSGNVISGRCRGSDCLRKMSASARMQCLFLNYTISLLTSRFATKSVSKNLSCQVWKVLWFYKVCLKKSVMSSLKGRVSTVKIMKKLLK